MNFVTASPVERSAFYRFDSKEYNAANTALGVNTAQAINTYGFCFRYYTRSYNTSHDKIWGEDTNARYDRYFDFMARYDTPDSNMFFSKFGLEQDDSIKIFVSKIHFETASGQYHPKTGDVIERVGDHLLYEIVSVPLVNDYTYFQRPTLIWEFIVKTYRDEELHADPAVSGTTISIQAEQEDYDIVDIRNLIESKKDEVLYHNKPGETPQQNPWATW